MATRNSTDAPRGKRSIDLPKAQIAADDVMSERLRAIHNSLLIGLASYGEIERLCDARDVLTICGKKFPDELSPIHPTASPDTISDFAEALRALASLQNDVFDANEAASEGAQS